MAGLATRARPDPAEAEAPSGKFVLSRVAGARIESDRVTVVNVLTGKRAELSLLAAPLIERFIEPSFLHDALIQAHDADGPSAMVACAGLIADMMALGILVDEAEETGPGPAPTELPAGWRAAEAFIDATRTSAVVEFLNTQEMSELLVLHLASGRQPSAYCDLPEAPYIALPDEQSDARAVGPERLGRSLNHALMNRRTTRRFDDRPMPIALLSHLLRLTWGETARVDNPIGDFFLRKTSPSGGALHSVEVYPIVRNVEGVPPGAYHYSVRTHGLERISDRHPDEWLVEAAADQYWLGECAVSFISAAFLPRMAWKYNFSRAFRAVMAEAGHLSQTLNLVATSLDLAPFTTAALRDEIVERELKLDPRLQPPLILNGVGYPERGVDRTRPRLEQADASFEG